MRAAQIAAAAAEIINAPIPAIGSPWSNQGGRNGGLMRGINGGRDYWLIYADDPTAEAELPWGGYGKDEPGAKSEHDGLANTSALIASEHEHPAAEFAGKSLLGGFADWYIAARREWRVLGGNVPDAFKPGWYLTSTQFSRLNAWLQYFGGGPQTIGGKDYPRRVRLVRRLFL